MSQIEPSQLNSPLFYKDNTYPLCNTNTLGKNGPDMLRPINENTSETNVPPF